MANLDDDYNGGQLVIVAVVLLALTYISVLLRTFVRLFITKSFSADDWLMLVAQAIFTLSCSFILRGVHNGLGRHNLSVPLLNRTRAIEYQDLATLTYVANMAFIKLSIGVFLLRIAVQKRYIWTLKISMAIISIWSLASDSFVAAAYSISVMTILSDWLYALIPIPMIWSVKMSIQKKLTVMLVLSLGVFASIATLIRMKYLLGLGDTSDIMFTGTTAMVWTLVEPGVAITAASLITIRPLLRALNLKGFDSTGAYKSNPSRSRQPPRTHNVSLRGDLPSGDWQSITSSNEQSTAELAVPERCQAEIGDKMHTGASVDDCESEEFIIQGLEEGQVGKTMQVTVMSAQ